RMHGLLEQRHLDPALGPELRLHELLHHDADVLRWQRRIELAEYLDSLVGVLVMNLVPSRRAAWMARSFSGLSFIAWPVAMPSCDGMSGKSAGLTSTRYLLSPPRVRNRMTGMEVTSTTPFSNAVSAPLRLPSAVICTSPCLSPAFSITSTPIISPSDFGLLMPNFLPLRSAAVLSGESGMTIITRSASEREVKLTILTS